MSSPEEKLKQAMYMTLMGYLGQNRIGLSGSIVETKINIVAHFQNAADKIDLEDVEFWRQEIAAEFPEVQSLEIEMDIGYPPKIDSNRIWMDNYDGRAK